MRIEQLTVDGFGHFEKQRFELKPGMNVLFGHNEAGKSTLLAFIRAVLFGFERKRSPHRYERAQGAFGGELKLITADGPLWVRRQGGKRAEGELSLRGETGAPLPPSRLADALAGISRELFYEVFAFSLGELSSFERLAEEGSVSEALFAAGMQGAHNLPSVVERLRRSADALFAPRGQKKALNVVLSELDEVRGQLKALGDRPAAYGEALSRCAALEAELAQLERQRAERQHALEVRSRLLQAAEDLAAHAQAEARMAALPDVRRFPPNGVVRLDELIERSSRAQAEREACARKREGFEEQRAWLQRAHQLEREKRLDHGELEAALEAFRARASEREALPARRAALDERFAQLERALEGLGARFDLEGLLAIDLGGGAKSKVTHLRDLLVNAERALDQRAQAWRRFAQDRERIEAEVRRLTAEVSTLPRTPVLEIRRQVQALQKMDPLEADLLRAEEQRAERQAALDAISAQAEPAPWHVFPAWLLAGIFVAVVGAGVAQLALSGRDNLWPLFAGGLVVAVVSAMVHRRAGREHRQQLASYNGKQAFRAREVARLSSDLTAQTRRVAELGRTLDELSAQVGLRPGASAAERRQREEALHAQLGLVERRERLSVELEALSPKLSSAVTDELHAKADRDVAEAERSRLSRELDERVVALGFPQGLGAQQVVDLWTEAAALKDRLLDLRAQKRAYEAALEGAQAVAQRLLEVARPAGLAVDDAETAAQALAALLRQGQEAKEEGRVLEERIEALSGALARADQIVAETRAAIDALLAQAGAANAEAFRERAAQADEYREAERLKRERALRIEARTGLSAEAAAARLQDEGGVAALAARLEEERGAIEALKQSAVERTKALAAAQQTVARYENETEVAALRAREESLAKRAAALAESYAVERLALALIAQARRRFEEEQQPKVIQLASQVFSELTQGRYTRVYPCGESKRDLCIREADGRQWRAEQLSRGTREQLYLAFRLAVIEDFGDTRVPLPIIVDDILVNFDPERTHATLRVLGRLARRHQVIAFTCHPGLKEMFRQEGAEVITLARGSVG